MAKNNEDNDLLQKVLDEISQDEKEGKTQFFVKHVPVELLQSFREKIVATSYEGSTHNAICDLMRQALDKEKVAKELPPSNEGWYIIPKELGDKMISLLQTASDAMPVIERVVAALGQQRK